VEQHKISAEQMRPGKGEAIEKICSVMAALSVIGGLVGAFAYSYPDPTMGFLGAYRASHERSTSMIALWLCSGIGTAIFWYALSGIGRIVLLLEFMSGLSTIKPDNGGRAAPSLIGEASDPKSPPLGQRLP